MNERTKAIDEFLKVEGIIDEFLKALKEYFIEKHRRNKLAVNILPIEETETEILDLRIKGVMEALMVYRFNKRDERING